MDWMAHGACVDTGVEFVTDPVLNQSYDAARAVCSGCVVREECKAYGREHWELGVWGGEDDVDRVLAMRVVRTSCGTCGVAAVVTVSDGVAACEACGAVQ